MKQVGSYRLLSRLGAGGMGVAYTASDAGGRVVVVKVLRPEVAEDPAGRLRLAREVDTMRRVRSPYVAQVLDADIASEPPYIVTQYARGPSLREHVEQAGPLRGEALLRFATGLAEAVWAIHGAGIVHRDLTPGNVLVVDGEPVVIDFGIAWAVDATRLTMTGMVVGTPGYLAVELLDGAQAGPAVDVFALGATLAYAAGGRHPFGSGPLQAVHFRMVTGRHDLSAVPAVLAEPLRAALAAEPARRPSARELRDWFRRLDPALLHVPAGDPGPRQGAGSGAAAGAPAGASGPAAAETPNGDPRPAEGAWAGAGPGTGGGPGPGTGSPGAPRTGGAPNPPNPPSPPGPAGPMAAPSAAQAGADAGTVRAGLPTLPRGGVSAAVAPVLVVSLTLALTTLPTWVWAPWGIIAGSIFTWLRMGYRGPYDPRSMVIRITVEAVLAAGFGTAAIWGVAIMVWFGGRFF